MRLLFVIDSFTTGGAQRQMVNLAVALRARSHDVEFYSYHAGGDFLEDPLRRALIPIVRHTKKNRFSLLPVWHIRKLIKARRYDAMLSFLETPNVYATMAAHSVAHRPPVVVSQRTCDPEGGPAWQTRLIRQVYRFADHVVVNSHYQRKRLARMNPWLQGRLSTIYNGVDLNAFVPPPVEPAPEPFRLLVISAVRPTKNGLCLVRALDILKREYAFRPMVSWLGEHQAWVPERHAYGQQMQAEIAAAGLVDQWRWVPQTRDVVSHLHQAHAVVHPSYIEGLPNAVCEAMACARPVIASHAAEHPLLVEDGVTGFLFDWRSPRALADCIYRLGAMSPQARTSMGVKGRELAMRLLLTSRLAEQYESLFERLMRGRAVSALRAFPATTPKRIS